MQRANVEEIRSQRSVALDGDEERGGIPLFNQTDRVTPAQLQRALGDRLKTFSAARRKFDPTDRLLNDYFRQMLSGASPATAP